MASSLPAGCRQLVSEARISRSPLRTHARNYMSIIGSCALVNQVLMTRGALPEALIFITSTKSVFSYTLSGQMHLPAIWC